MIRTDFVRAAIVYALAPASASSPEPSPSGVSGPQSAPDCDKNRVLPYDRRLEIVDSVLDGPEFRLSNYRGFAVWINIFATWCGPCRAEQPAVVAAAEKYHDRGLRTFGLFAGETDDAVRAYRKKFAIGYPLIRDENAILTQNLQGDSRGTVFPAHVFISPEGRLFCYKLGGLSPERLDAEIAAVLPTDVPTAEATAQR